MPYISKIIKMFSRLLLTEDIISNKELLLLEDDIRRNLDTESIILKFPEKLEKLFNSFETPLNKWRYFFLGLIGLVIYNLFLISDYFMTPDTFKNIAIMRLAIISPTYLCLLFLMLVFKSKYIIESIMGFNLLITSMSSIFILKYTSNIDITYFTTGFILIPIYFILIVRINLRIALICSAIIQFSYIYLLSYIFIHYILVESIMKFMVESFLILIMALIISLIGNYQLRTELRRGILLTMIEKISSIKLEETNRELMLLSALDSLTGLANRRNFEIEFEKEWRDAQRKNQPISIIFIDIDQFKLYNDTYGHQAGDECLKIVAGLLKKFARRPHDICARYGGEEFVIVLPELNLSQAVKLAEKIRISVEGLNLKYKLSRTGPSVTISLGAAEAFPATGGNKNSLLESADKALYMAKSGGRNRVCM